MLQVVETILNGKLSLSEQVCGDTVYVCFHAEGLAWPLERIAVLPPVEFGALPTWFLFLDMIGRMWAGPHDTSDENLGVYPTEWKNLRIMAVLSDNPLLICTEDSIQQRFRELMFRSVVCAMADESRAQDRGIVLRWQLFSRLKDEYECAKADLKAKKERMTVKNTAE